MVRRLSLVATFSHPLAASLITTAICLLVNKHLSLVDDCPSCEDAIAFVSVFLGINVGFWCSKHAPALNTDLLTSWLIDRLFRLNHDLGAVALLKLGTGGYWPSSRDASSPSRACRPCCRRTSSGLHGRAPCACYTDVTTPLRRNM